MIVVGAMVPLSFFVFCLVALKHAGADISWWIVTSPLWGVAVLELLFWIAFISIGLYLERNDNPKDKP